MITEQKNNNNSNEGKETRRRWFHILRYSYFTLLCSIVCAYVLLYVISVLQLILSQRVVHCHHVTMCITTSIIIVAPQEEGI